MKVNIKSYDSAKDTLIHIQTVHRFVIDVIYALLNMTASHDNSKLFEPEKDIFDEYTPKLKKSTYGDAEYKQFLKEMGVGLNHHYEHNRHHPEHFENGINDMTLMDLIEMVCDWKAATLRHDDGNIHKSIDINSRRFNIDKQLTSIIHNTIKALGWLNC